MALAQEAVDPVKLLIAGKWESFDTPRSGEVYNPSTGRVIARVPFTTPADVDRAVQAAAAALPAWAETPVVDRARLLFRFRELLCRDAEPLACLVTR
jgi:malonate-semialdehyde dehydrogenase (acetylating) / methylmalonate-semialdehyde dehydrogenase